MSDLFSHFGPRASPLSMTLFQKLAVLEPQWLGGYWRSGIKAFFVASSSGSFLLETNIALYRDDATTFRNPGCRLLSI